MSLKTLKELPGCMAERAVKARKLAAENPTGIQFDSNWLPWAFDAGCGHWFIFDGNSSLSPFEKTEKERRRLADDILSVLFREDPAMVPLLRSRG